MAYVVKSIGQRLMEFETECSNCQSIVRFSFQDLKATKYKESKVVKADCPSCHTLLHMNVPEFIGEYLVRNMEDA